jgi:endoglucanase
MRKYLKELVDLNGIPGKETKVSEYIEEKIKEKVDEIHKDILGNLIVLKKGKNNSKRQMVAAHMDEVGFLISKINEDGTFNIVPAGGVDPRVVKAQRLMINGEIPAVVNSKPIHLDKNLESVEGYDSIKVFAGFTKKEQTKGKVKIGDMVTFDIKYIENENHAIAKAFDDRAGCSVMMDLIDYYHENNILPEYDTYFCFVVQEETGLRGSGSAAEYVKPDAALILEGTTAGDNPENEPGKWATHLGNGAVLTFMHSGVVLDEDLYNMVVKTAKENNINHQFKMRTAGGTDAARLAKTMYGIPAAVISVPCRYLHSPNTIINLSDYENVFNISKILLTEGRVIK